MLCGSVLGLLLICLIANRSNLSAPIREKWAKAEPSETASPEKRIRFHRDRISPNPSRRPTKQGELPNTNRGTPQKAVLGILAALSVAHLLNDTMQSLIPAIYPILKHSFQLSFTQIGLITLANQLTASLLQPLVGWYTDRRPLPYSLSIGMTFTLAGLGLLSAAWNFEVILVSVALVGVGSSVFHPEASRVARMASGGRHGFAQSLFQVGGNAGTSIGPLLAALIIVPGGQPEIKWFCLIALVGIMLLYRVGQWYVGEHPSAETEGPRAGALDSGLSSHGGSRWRSDC